jgi:hypothetical protein
MLFEPSTSLTKAPLRKSEIARSTSIRGSGIAKIDKNDEKFENMTLLGE